MKGLRFQRLVLISDSKKLANQFEFPKRLNLVTGNDNSVGKSSLVKSLFWTIGCDPEFDQEWKSNDIKAILYFSVESVDYIVSRYNDSIAFGIVGEKLKKYSKITGEYSVEFAKTVGFDLVLASRSDQLECPPPAYYFLPFYIDQKRSWSVPWNGYENLSQFSRFKPTLIKYFCGYIKPRHFELEGKIFEEKISQKEADNRVERIGSALEVVAETFEHHDRDNVAFSVQDFEKMQNEINTDLQQFTSKQARVFDAQAQAKSDVYDLKRQLSIALASIDELEKDYKFAVECVPDDELECPLCGTVHDNSLIKRAGLLTSQSALEEQAFLIQESLEKKQDELAGITEELNVVKQDIDRINKKYMLEEKNDKEEQAAFERAWSFIAHENVSRHISKEKEVYELKSHQAVKRQKELKLEQRKLTTKEEKDELDEIFIGNLVKSIRSLSALGVNLSGVKSPVDYKKILGGGAAEGTRGVLAYQLALLQQIEHAGNCVTAPFVVDTPNQQEQAEHRYQEVVDVLKKRVPEKIQIILCGMDNEALSPFKKEANVIFLDAGKLLHRSPYEHLREEYERVVIDD